MNVWPGIRWLAAAGILLHFSIPTASSQEIVASAYGVALPTAPLAVAMERHEFEKHGVKITGIIASQGGGTSLRNLIAGDILYGEVSPSAALAAIKEGVDIKIIAMASPNASDLVWISMPKNNIRSIMDLKGKKIGITNPGSSSEEALLWKLEAAGIDRSEVNLVAVGGFQAGLTLLEAGGVDATPINEPLWSARRDRYAMAFDLSDLPHAAQLVGVTTAKIAKEQPEKLRAILAARRSAVDYIYANPEEAAKVISKEFGNLDVGIATKAVKSLAQMKYWSAGNIEMESLDNVVKTMTQQGKWKGPVDWASIIDRSFLPADLQN